MRIRRVLRRELESVETQFRHCDASSVLPPPYPPVYAPAPALAHVDIPCRFSVCASRREQLAVPLTTDLDGATAHVPGQCLGEFVLLDT